MKLSELVAFRNELNSLSVIDIEQEASARLKIITHLLSSKHSETNISSNELEQDLVEIQQTFKNFNSTLDQLKKQINDQISEAEKVWFRESYKEFEVAQVSETTHHILNNRRPTRTEKVIEAEEILRARIASFGNWRYPGIIIRPGLEDFIESMVGFDPLYVIDRNYELLEPAIKRFPKVFQNRLRPYTVNDWSEEPLLAKIPKNQFGICLVYNVFNYRPLEIIRRYLTEIYEKLRPGGVLIMTYNDCDRAHAVKLVEMFAASYTPGYLVQDLAKSIGFEQTYTWSDGGPSVWLELQKPGNLVSYRGGQSIAKVHRIDDYLEDVDFLKRKPYTNIEITKLHAQARELNIDEAIIENYKPYELQVLVIEILQKQHEQELINRRRKKEKRLEKTAKKYGIDTSLPHWPELAEQKLIEEEEEKKRQEREEFYAYARSHGVDPLAQSEDETHRLIAEEVDRRKKEELKQLRIRAAELQAGDPNMIKYGYSAEKLKQLIKAKEEEQK